jgi:hypothetical protein
MPKLKLLPVSYAVGLVFLPKQYRLEKKAVRDNMQRHNESDAYDMKPRR